MQLPLASAPGGRLSAERPAAARPLRLLLASVIAARLLASETVATSYYLCEDVLRIERGGQRCELLTRTLVQIDIAEEVVTLTVRGDQALGVASRIYAVQAGDTLTRIAERELGSRERWRDIAALNPALDVRQPLRVGQRLALPGGREGDPASVQITLPNGAVQRRAVPTLRLEIARDEGRRALRDGQSVPAALARELDGMLAQGPAVNALRSNSRQPYGWTLLLAGKEQQIAARQLNGKLWADLTISGSGEAEIGGREWQLPMRFEVPAQRLPDGMQISGRGELLYASIRPGAEGEVTLQVELVLPWGRIERRWYAQPVLRQLPAPAATASLRDSAPLAGAGAWTRVLGLGLLAVHRLPGISEAGLLSWTTAVASEQALLEPPLDLAAELQIAWPAAPGVPLPGQVPRAEYEQVVNEREAARAELAQARQEAERLARQGISDWRAEVDIAGVGVQASATVGNGDAAGLGIMPTALARLAFGESFRWGLSGAYQRWSTAGDTASASWGVGGGGLWAGWQGDGWHLAAIAAAGLGAGTFNDGRRSVTLTTLGFLGELVVDAHIADRWSLGLRGSFATGEIQQLMAMPSLRFWWRPAFALQLAGCYLQASGAADERMDVSASAFGVGLGLVLRR
ncbi:MAG: LysM peptidoglycan-binding domain-containing protein [Planctomycetota bacterium]|nr:LysM peptidoglycan-binding domain-containing protein [Planctomycetota bacterium]